METFKSKLQHNKLVIDCVNQNSKSLIWFKICIFVQKISFLDLDLDDKSNSDLFAIG